MPPIKQVNAVQKHVNKTKLINVYKINTYLISRSLDHEKTMTLESNPTPSFHRLEFNVKLFN